MTRYADDPGPLLRALQTAAKDDPNLASALTDEDLLPEAQRLPEAPRRRPASAIGDELQSAASRLAEYVTNTPDAPYEVQMAAGEAESASEQWTELRRRSASASATFPRA